MGVDNSAVIAGGGCGGRKGIGRINDNGKNAIKISK